MMPRELPAEWPLSVSLWVHFDQAPGEGQTGTVLWYGKQQSSSQHLRIEATPNATSGLDVTATLAGSTGSVSAVAEQLPTEEWMMLTVIVGEEGQLSHRITLFINDAEEDTAATNIGSTMPDEYDHFVLGADNVEDNFGRFHAEHVAVWEPDSGNPLSPSNIAELYEQRWVPFQYPQPGPTPPLGRVPGIAYWMFVGHWTAGIDAANDQNLRSQGQLFNQASDPAPAPEKPPLQMLDTSKPVVWSAKTPVMRYKTPQQKMDPGPIVHPIVPPVSRLQPHFFVWEAPSLDLVYIGTHKYAPHELPAYTHPNFILRSGGSSESAQSIPLDVETRTDYLPPSDIALLAKRCADWFELQGFTQGRGSVGDGLYEGYIFLREIAMGRLRPPGNRLQGFRGSFSTPDTSLPTIVGTDDAIPLETHPLDWVEPGAINPYRRWHTWFNANGKRLVKDYMDAFWTALKRELDERNLCYPRTLWWDYENWAQSNFAVRADENPDPPPPLLPHGTFTLQLEDDRATSEPLMGSATYSTLDEIWSGTGPPEDYNDFESVGHDDNKAFRRWYLGWSIAIGQKALWDAMMEKATELFPLTVWSNYHRFVADNPGFVFPGHTAREAVTTPPAGQAFIHGDFSSPMLYTGDLQQLTAQGNRLFKELGVTYTQVLRNGHKARIDACANAFTAKPLAPWFEMGSRRYAVTGGQHYHLSDEDAFDVLAHAWKRGVDNFLLFAFEDTVADEGDSPSNYESGASEEDKKTAHDRMYDVAFRLLNHVHWMPQENHARVARVSRRGW